MPNHPEQETAIVVATDILLRSIAVIINASRVSAIALFLSAMNTEQLKARPSEFKQFAKKTLFPKGPPPLAETGALLVESQKFKCFSGKSCQNFDLRQNARGAAASGICNCSHIPTRLWININSRKSGHIKSFRFSKRKMREKFTFVGPTGS